MNPAPKARPPKRSDEIVVVGAGPAGLSAAYFLKQNGYRNVTVMEKLGRVGGLCFTATEDYTCFDLGANYLTPDYRETLRLAREFNIEMYPERHFVIAQINPDQAGYKATSAFAAARGDTSTWRFVRACLKYAWLRWRLGPVVDPPGHAGIHRHPDLCRPFLDWLKANDLECLQRFFEMPITVMGYGYLDEIPTPYALKYIGVRTFIAMCIKALPITSWWPWPKRFCLGFQWLWQTVARELNVWVNIEIKKITRRDDGRLAIQYSHREQNLHDERSETDEFAFDHLILACPLTPKVLSKFLELSEEETAVFGQVQTFAYCMTSLKIDLPNLPVDYAMATIPLTRIGTPWAITKQADTSNFIQFYTRIDPGDLRDDEMTRQGALDEVHAFIKRFGGNLDHIKNDAWHSFDRWPYFKHVKSAAFSEGYYERLEALQGQQNTYYVGGLLDFELVERIVRYSQKLVAERFPPV
jgi:hypothetical protein